MAILLERGLIGRRFDKSYRLHGKPGVYYLMPEGARRLQTARGTEINIKNIYKDKDLSEQFVRYSLELLTIYIQLKSQHGAYLGFYTRSILNHEDYEYFPQPLPYAYVTLKGDERKRQFFLEVLHNEQPWFVAVRTILKHIKYAEDGDWGAAETNLPSILLICESERLAKQVLRRIPKALADSYDEDIIEFAVATKEDVLSEKAAIWRTEVNGESYALGQLDEWTEQ
ncbi:MAG TPA: hypothetical protein VLF59_02340 [Candidatus Saccharimonadales bacterium]|nr:hypothetical protein [Candidatus Saccharimonadales bacterium]